MTTRANSFPTRQIAGKTAPFAIVVLAGIAARTSLASAYPMASLVIFLWIVSDTMMLTLIVRTAGRPSRPAVLGVMAGASFTVWLGSTPAIREVLWTTPVIAAGMAIMVLGHVTWGIVRARRMLTSSDHDPKDRWSAAASEILPRALVRLAAAELTIIYMALFRWGGPADVPANARAFNYHRHLTPRCATLLILSIIEVAVSHLLVGHWSQTAAIVMFVLSDVALVYLVGLIKSFRFRPILVTPEGVRVRAGFLIDQLIPLNDIANVETSFAGEQIRDPATLNAALLAWPNILLRLRQPMPRRSFFGRKGPFTSVAFRLDDPEPFLRLLLWRLDMKPD